MALLAESQFWVSDVTAQVQSRKESAESAKIAHEAQAEVLRLLESSIAELRGFFMQAPTPMVILEGREFRFTLANPPYEKLIGRRALGRTVAELFPKGEAEFYIPLLTEVYETGNPFVGKELLFTMPDENGVVKTVWIDIGYHPFRNEEGVIKGVLAIVHDVTESVLARRAIETSEEKLRIERSKLEAIFYGTDSPMVLFRGPNLVFEMANQKYLDMISNREVIGKTLIEALPEIAESAFPNIIQIVYNSGEPYRFLEGHTPIKNLKTGELEDRYFDTTFARITDHADKEFLVIGHAMDVTERVQSRKELEEAKHGAELATSLKSSFLANMSHEIRTPLGAILGFTDLLRDRGLSPEQRTQFIDTISRNGKALTTIIDDILDLAKVESGKLEIEKVEFSFFELIDDVVDVFREGAKAKHIFLRSNIVGEVPERILADPTRLRQIFLNVVGNAVKFTHEGGVTIKVSCEEINNLQRCKVSVKDTGVGMTKEQQGRLFQPFTQADNSTTRKFGGTGLGLALSKRLANALGGDVAIENCEYGQGCTFVFSFLVEVVQSRNCIKGDGSKVSSENELAPLTGLRILVADDSPDNQALVQILLKRQGAVVEAAENGRVAVQMATHRGYDLILMDIQMPEMDGYEATKVLRAAGYHKPIVALTAHAMAEERDRSLAAGCTAHLTKPLDRQELVKTVRDLVFRN